VNLTRSTAVGPSCDILLGLADKGGVVEKQTANDYQLPATNIFVVPGRNR